MRTLAFSTVAILAIFLAGCQRQPESYFVGWQPPRPSQEKTKAVVLQSDEVLTAKRQLRPKMVFALPVPTATSEIVIEPRVKRIIVSISDQRLCAYGDDKEIPLASFQCSTAAGGAIYPLSRKSDAPHNHIGEFTIDRKDIDLISGIYNCPMPYALHFFEGHWIHATEPRFYPLLGQPASHGCIRLRGIGSNESNDAAWLYSHTPVGCRLTIR